MLESTEPKDRTKIFKKVLVSKNCAAPNEGAVPCRTLTTIIGKMARIKRVHFVSVAEFERVKLRMKAETAEFKLAAEIYARALAIVSKDMFDLTQFLRDILKDVQRVCVARRKLWRNRNLALVACGRDDCHNLVLRTAHNVGSRMRRCDSCAAEERALFQQAAHALAAAAPPVTPSPSIYLSTEDDTQSI